MKRKKIILAIATILGVYLTFSPTYIYTNQASAPDMHTGAPGEESCAKSGCHFQNPEINAAGIDLKSLGSGTKNIMDGYTTSETFDLVVTILPNTSTTGFQLTALDENGNTAGTLIEVANSFAQVTNGTNGRAYIGHKNNTGNKNFWNFKWTAPATAIPVKFYIAAVVGNQIGNVADDKVKLVTYRATTTTFGALSVGINDPINADDNSNIRVYPNPVFEKLKVDYLLDKNETVQVNLFSLDGRLVKELYFGEDNQGDYHRAFDLQGELSGLYLLKINIGENIFYKKIFAL